MENDKIETAEELLKRIQKLEEAHANLKQRMIDSNRQKFMSVSTLKMVDSCRRQSGGIFSLTESQCENILQSMGQSVHMFDLQGKIIYWNRMAEILYGYTVAEALGKTAPDIIIDAGYAELAIVIIQRAGNGESWFGEFPMRNKLGKRFSVITTLTPSRDEYGTINGVLCICADARPFKESRKLTPVSPPWRSSSTKFGDDPQQPLQTKIASKISNLVSKVKLRMNKNMDYDHGSEGDDYYSHYTPRDLGQDASPIWEYFTGKPNTDSGGGSENMCGIHKVLSSKAEAWMGKRGKLWPWKGNENERDSLGRFGLDNDKESVSGPQTSSSTYVKVESQHHDVVSINGAPRSWSSCETSNSVNKFHNDMDHLDVEISWNDLVIEECIGQGSYGTVYHAVWYGSDVAVKVFTKREYSGDVILSFRKEVSLMKRLRHPNILLFMGAITSPEHLCIVTEFLPRGSLFQLLQQNKTTLDWKRRVHMAIDIARGMNYLHQCHPPIIHRDLKSSNLLVDKKWTVKVGDFGISRIKHETSLTTNTGIGTPQWMAPEVLRNKQADEKSDVYSYGVVLWEITTGKFPWDNLDSIQVIGAVGFMNQRLQMPKNIDPEWTSLVESCWCSEPQSRPTFQEILTKLKDLHKKFAIPSRDSKT